MESLDWTNETTQTIGERCLQNSELYRGVGLHLQGACEQVDEVEAVAEFLKEYHVGFDATVTGEFEPERSDVEEFPGHTLGNADALVFAEMTGVDFAVVDWRQIAGRMIHNYRQSAAGL